ncbi:glycoside hydrolase family 3 C-terminal domain-containing protein [Robiginitalea sp. SC105]|uniref:glycoside hydrolase family 3 C-terminal domain-containing protein n=1 Tax=Robiginitalea sp. SC105 TaxID=2762332 RepID=UPI00163983D6|nr:glycoside hydrolase family 3 C-terminal domain-containing protein [Robiginitalea sp. SC105]MBC2838462.1 glycoside hydrolase family 3 C-terminal domain-containing protein [Robiginitalea sp. SC105]
MKKGLKTTLKIIGGLILLLLLAGVGGWWYLESRFLDFEGDFEERTEFPEITAGGYTFPDRNGNGRLDVYEDGRRPIKERADNLLSLMSVEEKIHLLKGSGLGSAMGRTEPGRGIPGAVGTIVPTPRLGIPAVYLSDGPAGLRLQPERENETRTYYCTAFPIGTLLASTWNTDLVAQVGAAMGNEAREYGVDVILGPGANIHRHPFCGRNFEYYSEDPVLTGYIGASMVNGIESQGVGSSVKHFVANNQETNRNQNDVIVSERALREIYLKGFELIVRNSQPWTIMSSYNKVNGTYVAESPELLTNILRGEWGFEGLVMSDWFGGNDAAAMVRAGNDLLEPGTKKQWDALAAAAESGELPPGAIDTAAGRILRLILQSGKLDQESHGDNPDLEAHAAITRQSASEGMVLLKNEGVLPLETSANLALLGVTSYDFFTGGTGSGDVNEAYTVSLQEGLRSTGLQREDGMGGTSFTVNATASSLYKTHRDAHAEDFVKPEGIYAMFTPYTPPEIQYSREQLLEIASGSDAAVITLGRNSGEGGDRVEEGDFLLTRTERGMIDLACEVFHGEGKPVIVVLNVGGVIETASWKGQPDAILLAWQGGQEGGNSVADILSGKVNPSGKLPMTFPVRVQDHASHANFPLDGRPMGLFDLISGDSRKPVAEREPNVDFTRYEEGIYVGYRHFDKRGLEVSYPFGFGLSYTEFSFGDLEVTVENDSIRMGLSVTNTGRYAGKEVVQIYVSKPDTAVDRPLQELKAFGKTRMLAPGETAIMDFMIPVRELRYWDENTAAWELEGGVYTFRAGTSSRDIRATAEAGL